MLASRNFQLVKRVEQKILSSGDPVVGHHCGSCSPASQTFLLSIPSMRSSFRYGSVTFDHSDSSLLKNCILHLGKI